MTKSTPTELELCALAVVARDGEATAYRLRRFLGRSLSSYWSDSAGSIYPLLERLEGRGWLEVRTSPWGTRIRRSYRLSRSGRRVLRGWLSPPLPEEATGHTYDPVRTRMFFLDLVSPSERREFVRDARERTGVHLRRHREDLAGKRAELTPWAILGREGAIAELEARVKWLEHVLAHLDSAVGNDSGYARSAQKD